MEKAKFFAEYRHRKYNENITEITYEYRGHKYTVDINHNKGNEPLAWQHKNAQGRIDTIIEMEERGNKENQSGISVDEALEELLNFWDN